MFFNVQRFIIVRLLLILVLTMSSVGIWITPAAAASGDTALISRTIDPSQRVQSRGASNQASLSADGRYVAFASSAANLVNNDTNGVTDIFVYDYQTDEMQRVSIALDGGEANGDSSAPSISADGRWVVFLSSASNLVSYDLNDVSDIFVYDRQTGVTTRISVASNGANANNASDFPSISANGRYVVFNSWASNLVNGDTNFVEDTFLRDLQLQVTIRVSVASGGTQANNGSWDTSISADGRYTAFISLASNLVSGDLNDQNDIFVHDSQTGETERVSVGLGGTDPNSNSLAPAISGDGHYVTFMSSASNLVSDDTNGARDIFIYDRLTDTTTRASVAPDGTEANQDSDFPSISEDGSYIAFSSSADNLVDNDTNNSPDIFVFDRQTGMTERVSVNSSGVEANYNSFSPFISGDGRYVAFESLAGNLAGSDPNEMTDIYLRDRQEGETSRISVGLFGITGNNSSHSPVISADGRYVAFVSSASDLVSGDTNGRSDIFVYDHQTGVTERLRPGEVEANNVPARPSISGDGRYIAFDSQATNLVSGDTNGQADVFVYDRDTEVIERVSVASDGAQANKYSYSASISADGRYVAFHSYATNLIGNDTNNYSDIFIHDLVTHITERVSVDSEGTQVIGESTQPSISADGRYVAFESSSPYLVSDDTNRIQDIFVHDRDTGLTERVSVADDGTQTNDMSFNATISGNGRYVAFDSMATNLVSGDTNNVRDVFVYDRDRDTIERVSVASSGIQAQQNSSSPSISADGRYVSFGTTSANLVSGDTNGSTDIFIRDRVTFTTQRVSLASDGKQANDDSVYASISGDGRYVAFESIASNLGNNDDRDAGDANNTYDVFLHENVLLRAPLTIYVKWNAEGANNGTSWADAYTNLQSALAAAASGDEIWVAAGTYKPTTGTDRTVRFQLRTGVAVYGGFHGTESVRVDRNPSLNITILSGDIDNNDSQTPVITDLHTVSGNTTNSYHVVASAALATLDGFTITAGYAGGPYTNRCGGLYNSGVSPKLANLMFSGNFAADAGGGMCTDSSSSPILKNVTFHDNAAGATGGGGIFNQGSSPILTNVTFSGNWASGGGGGMHNYFSDSTLTNVTFSGNSADNGGGMFNRYSKPVLTNVTFSSNTAASEGGGMFNDEGYNPTIRNTVFWGNAAASAGAQIYNDVSIPSVIDSIVQDGCPTGSTCTNIITADPVLGILGDYGGGTRTIPLLPGSSAIDSGNVANCPRTDQRGVARPQDGDSDGNAICDIGAYEAQPDIAPPTVSSIVRVGEEHTFAPSVNFTVTFSEAVTDVDVSDFTLDVAGAIINADITAVVPADACAGTPCSTYTVTVDTGTGNGTLGLDVVTDAKITDPAGNPLDHQPFIPDEEYTVEKDLALLIPANGEVLLHRQPTFDWSKVPDASSYRIETSQSSAFSTLLWKIDTTDSTYTPPADLPGGKVISWRVRALVNGVWSPWSQTWSFTTAKPPSIPVLVAPAHKAITKNYTPRLNWNDSTIPNGSAAFDHYQVQVSESKTFPEPTLIDAMTPSGEISASSYDPDITLTANRRYYWRVRSFNVAGEYSSWSSTWVFFTAILPPSNLAPTDGESVPTRKPLLDWDAVEGATGYNLQISTSDSFVTLLVNTPVTADMFTPSTRLPANKIIYWRVRATGPNGPSRWTTASFHTP